MDANMNTESKEVVFELESSLRELAAPEVELLLLHCYYVTSEKQLTKSRAAEKKKEYDLYKKSKTYTMSFMIVSQISTVLFTIMLTRATITSIF